MIKSLISCYIVFNKYPIEWLREALIGVKNIIYPNLEYVFVIYGKDNNYSSILSVLAETSIPFKIHIIDSTENFITAINFAVSKCNGEYIIRIDADDIIMPNSISSQFELMESTDSSMIITDYITIEKDGNHIKHDGKIENIVSHALIEKDKFEYVTFLKDQKFRDGTSIISTFKKYGFKIEYLNKVGFIHRLHDKNLTHDKELVKQIDNEIIFKDIDERYNHIVC